MDIKACIFDLDGVIVDTAKYHYIAWKRLANELGFDFTKDENEKLKGVSRMKSLDILLDIGKKQFNQQQKIDLANKKNNWYVDFISQMDSSEILPGVKEFLDTLKDNNIKIAIGSASKNTMLILNNINLTTYFDAIIDGNKVTKAKPDPEVFLLGAKELNVKPKDCVVFEDAVAGIEAALAANMKAIGIGSSNILKNANKVIPGFNNIDLNILNF